ncbi:hypothetical protein B0H12DRAFT_356879 [Mycena haematopus]|nr:hypothetical protein B0H12DRAFT_356879 [Mycena haematopus]
MSAKNIAVTYDIFGINIHRARYHSRETRPFHICSGLRKQKHLGKPKLERNLNPRGLSVGISFDSYCRQRELELNARSALPRFWIRRLRRARTMKYRDTCPIFVGMKGERLQARNGSSMPSGRLWRIRRGQVQTTFKGFIALNNGGKINGERVSSNLRAHGERSFQDLRYQYVRSSTVSQ